MIMSISVIGLGMMGRPMARTLLEAGCDVRGWNRSALSPDLTEGIPICRTIQEASQADVCLLMLLDSTAVDAVLEEMETHLKAGQVVMDMSSSDPTHSTDHAQRLAAKGIGWIDDICGYIEAIPSRDTPGFLDTVNIRSLYSGGLFTWLKYFCQPLSCLITISSNDPESWTLI